MITEMELRLMALGNVPQWSSRQGTRCRARTRGRSGRGGLSLYQVSDDQDIKAYAHCALIRQIQNFSADSRTPRSPSGFL
jgi:hypothetical protein